jgi:uncharacterized cysteine cluster protein YcgN (CxxCxxCC family)
MTGQEGSFWRRKKLTEMSREEWESLCDGCARCCLHKYEDEDSEEIFNTRVVCRLLDEARCQCTSYHDRHNYVPECLYLKPEQVPEFHWLPASCAYRTVSEGKPLPWWHHLVSGSRETVHEAGISVRGKVISEEHVHPDGWDEHIIHWVE